MKQAPPVVIRPGFLQNLVIAVMFGSLAFVACEASDGTRRSEDLGVFTASETPARLEDESPVYFVEDDGTVGGRLVPSDIELIYEEIRIQDPSGKEISRTVRGEQTMEIWQRTSTPQFFTDASEPYLYFEEGGTQYLEDGSQRHVYHIRRQPNRSQNAKPLTPPGPPRVDAVVFEKWAQAGENDLIQLNARLSGIPDFQPPPIPPPGMFSGADEQRARDQQAAYLKTYYENFSTLSGRFQAELEAAGGRIVEVMPDIGWISFQVPQIHVDSMLSHAGIDRLTSPYVETIDTGCFSGPGYALNCTSPTPTDWLLGQGRIYTRLDSQKFLNAGIDGSITSARHGGLPRLQAGIVESKQFENESLALRDVNLNTRISSLTNCTTDPCTYPTDFADDQMYNFGGTYYWYEFNAYHGTAVSSVLAGDFLRGQADGKPFGDPNYDDSDPFDLTHCADWENASTGMAPGTAVQYAFTGGG
ncbi:hypothetical protein KKD52_11300, partial [Myxococcota bacterium]|nr:hypothetical protein [Myxococcota bacterium]MBU1510938.1 hypothetical protein [Myxococcota bacterium]